jgi:aldose 1-epimerase
LPIVNFNSPEIFGNTFLDNCFLVNDNDKPACILTNTKTGLRLIINPGKSYPYLQVYTPDHRNSIAIENLSAVPDAFNNKIGLTILNAGESVSFETSFSIVS